MALRTALSVQPHLYIGDSKGRPLDYGMVYFGQPDKDPEFYPINIYHDEALTIAIAQPVRSKGGFMYDSGQMVEVYAAELEYSVKVLDVHGVQVFYKPKMRRSADVTNVSVKEFDAIGDGVANDTIAIDSALATDQIVTIPNGNYLYTGDIDAFYAKKPTGTGFIIYDGYKYPVKPESRVNHLWQGAFNAWQMGHADSVSTVQRRQIPAGVTHARRGFASGVTIYHVNGNYDQHALKVARTVLNTSNATHNIVINLTPSETMPLAGKTCTLMYHCNHGSDWLMTDITVKAQASKELMQPILRDDGKYTSGNIELISKSHQPILRPQSAPYLLTFDVPIDATQVSISIDIPFSGTAGNEDWVEFEQMCLAVSDDAFDCVADSALSTQNKAATRYQTSYQSGVHRGAPIEQGTMQAMAVSASATYAVAMAIRFEPPMAHTPWFTFQSPTSGTEFRLLNKRSGSTVNGQAYDLNNKGVTITNNGAVVAGDRLLCHWTAESLF